MPDFEEPQNLVPPSAELQAEKAEHKRAELCLKAVQAVNEGIFRGLQLDAIEGSDWGDITITRKNADMVSDMIRLRYAERFPDLFTPLDQQIEQL